MFEAKIKMMFKTILVSIRDDAPPSIYGQGHLFGKTFEFEQSMLFRKNLKLQCRSKLLKLNVVF